MDEFRNASSAMTVGALIAQLSALPPDTRVFYNDSEWGVLPARSANVRRLYQDGSTVRYLEYCWDDEPPAVEFNGFVVNSDPEPDRYLNSAIPDEKNPA